MRSGQAHFHRRNRGWSKGLENACHRFTPVTLELGGKHPFLVLDDADIGRAVEGAAWVPS